MTDKDKEEEYCRPPSISEAIKRPHSELCLRIIQFREDHKRKVLEKLSVLVKLFEDSLEVLSESVESLNYVQKSGWGVHQGYQLAFIATLPKTLFSAFDQIMSGDYSEGMGTCRNAYETSLRICFLEAYPNCSFSTIGKPTGETHFQPANFLKDNLKVATEDPFYQFLSFPAHSHRYTVVRAIVEGHQKGGMPVFQGFEYNENDTYLAFKYLLGITYVSIRVVAGLFNKHLVTVGRDIKDPTALTDLMKELPDRYKALPGLMDSVMVKLHEMGST